MTDTKRKRRNKTFVSNYLKDACENKVFQQSMGTVSWGETTEEVAQHRLEAREWEGEAGFSGF